MDQHLYKYLVLHKHLCIPQLGSFIIQNEPAHFDEASGLLYPPKPVISFSEGNVPVSEKLFFDFLSNEMGTDELAAIKQFHDFSYRFRNDLQENKLVVLKGAGTLSREEDGTILFSTANEITELLPPVDPGNAVMMTVSEETEDTGKPDQWWIYAIVLVMLGIGALLYYYM